MRGAARDGRTRVALSPPPRSSPRRCTRRGGFGEAQRLTEEAEALAAAGDLDAQARWRATRAKVLARRGQFAAARQLAGEAEALVAPTLWAAAPGRALVAQAEVAKLAGAPAEAAASLRTALRIYQDRRAVALAGPDPGRAGQPARRTGNRPAGPVQPGLNRSATSLAERWLPATITRRSP